jgi:hypothetical protein
MRIGRDAVSGGIAPQTKVPAGIYDKAKPS